MSPTWLTSASASATRASAAAKAAAGWPVSAPHLARSAAQRSLVRNSAPTAIDSVQPGNRRCHRFRRPLDLHRIPRHRDPPPLEVLHETANLPDILEPAPLALRKIDALSDLRSKQVENDQKRQEKNDKQGQAGRATRQVFHGKRGEGGWLACFCKSGICRAVERGSLRFPSFALAASAARRASSRSHFSRLRLGACGQAQHPKTKSRSQFHGCYLPRSRRNHRR